jgi:hypothetical protein
VKATKRATNAVYARVTDDGMFYPADQVSRDILRRKKVKRGALVRLVVSSPRDYPQWKKAHQLGTFIANNLDEFMEFASEDGKIDSHGALKKLQRLSGVECEDSDIDIPGVGKMVIRTPRSLAFDEMEEGQFQAAYSGFCQYLINRWWRDMDEAQIEEAASLVGMGS